jgi:glycosyltransferase involved in cell wall biosynthesis
LAARGIIIDRRRTRPEWSPRLQSVVQLVRPPFQSVERFDPDILCISQGTTYDFSSDPLMVRALRRSTLATKPTAFICQLNGERGPTAASRAHAIQLFGRATLVAFVADRNRRQAERHLATRLDNATVVRNPAVLRGELPVAWPTDEEARIGVVARLQTEYKAQDVLFECLSDPEWRRRSWSLSLAGQGDDERYLRDLASFYGIADRVRFMGHVSDVRRFWQDHHLLVLPSRDEGTPLALVEAMLCGRPAVATDVGGVGEWLEDGQTGFLAAACSVPAISGALEQAWHAQPAWRELGEAAHVRARLLVDPTPGKTLFDLITDASDTSGARG